MEEHHVLLRPPAEQGKLHHGDVAADLQVEDGIGLQAQDLVSIRERNEGADLPPDAAAIRARKLIAQVPKGVVHEGVDDGWGAPERRLCGVVKDDSCRSHASVLLLSSRGRRSVQSGLPAYTAAARNHAPPMAAPPSTSTVRPVKKSHSMMNLTASQTSSGRPSRPSGMASFKPASDASETPSRIGVSITPGATPPTRIPKGASSSAQVRVAASSPAFDAA